MKSLKILLELVMFPLLFISTVWLVFFRFIKNHSNLKGRVLLGMMLFVFGTHSYAIVLDRDDFPDVSVQDNFNGGQFILALDDFGQAHDEFIEHNAGYKEYYSKKMAKIEDGKMPIPRDEWVYKTYSFGKQNANRNIQIKFSATLTGGWNPTGDYLWIWSSDTYHKFYATGGDGSRDVTISSSYDATLDSNGNVQVWISPKTDDDDKIAKIDYVRIDLESTDGYVDYYSDKPRSDSINGQLVVAKKQWVYKTYDFGTEYANQTVIVEFSAELTKRWERNDDYFWAWASSEYHAYYSNGNFSDTITKSFSAKLDANGKVQVWLSPRTNSSREISKINYVKIYKIDTDGYVGYNDPSSIYTSGGKLVIPQKEWAHKQYNFGKENAYGCITVDFSALLTKGWESTGDYFEAYVNGYHPFYADDADGQKDIILTKMFTTKLDANGIADVWLSPRTDQSEEIAKVDYFKINLGNPEGYIGYYNPQSICVANSRIIVPQKEWIYKTYDFGTSRANQDVSIKFSADLTGGWNPTGDYLWTWSSGTYHKFYATGGNGSSDVHISGAYTGTLDANGKLQVWISPITDAVSKIAKIDFVEISDSTNIDADLKLTEYAAPFVRTMMVLMLLRLMCW